MIEIQLNAFYSWAAMLAVQDGKRPEHWHSALVGFRAQNALLQHLNLPPVNKFTTGNDICINYKWYEVKLLNEGKERLNGCFFFKPHQIDHSGFIVMQQLRAQRFGIYGFISTQKALFVAEQVAEKLYRVRETHLDTRWQSLDSCAIMETQNSRST